MAANRKTISRRQAFGRLGGLALSCGAGLSAGSAARAQIPNLLMPLTGEIPITGKGPPELTPLDTGMVRIMQRHAIPGAAFAVAHHGKLLFAKGYGCADCLRDRPVHPETLFGLASVSKPITAYAVLKLIEQNKVGLDDRVFDIVKDIELPQAAKDNPWLREISVRHCLNHSVGWDRTACGDPIYWEPLICQMLRTRPPLSPSRFLTYALSMPMQFRPGTETCYSNVGYILLGEVIARVSEQPYERFVTDEILKPLGMKKTAPRPAQGKYLPGESLRYLPGSPMPLHPMRCPLLLAAGGWSASVVDMARFMTDADGSRGQSLLKEKTRQLMLAPPPKPVKANEDGSYYGLGWEDVRVDKDEIRFGKGGSHLGMGALVKRLASGITFVFLCNTMVAFDPIDLNIAAHAVRDARRLIEEGDKKLLDVDYFRDFS